MALKRIRYEDELESFRIEGGPEVGFRPNGDLVLPLDWAGDVSLAHLANALKRYESYYGGRVEAVFLTSDPGNALDHAQREVWVTYDRGSIETQAGFSVDPSNVPRAQDIEALVGPLLKRHRAAWAGSWRDDDDGFVSVGVSAFLTGGARSVNDLYELGVDLQLLLAAAGGAAELTPETALDLLKARRVEVLAGQPEGISFDAKERPYPLAKDAQKWELAKDVAAFANTGRPALIVIGVINKATPSGDVFGAPKPFPVSDMDVVAVRASLRDRVTPMIPDLDVGVIEAKAGYGYGWIYIPTQPRELQPFMVSGALAGDAWLGRHVSIPVRSGEDTGYLDAAAIHSFLAAGRAALRGVD